MYQLNHQFFTQGLHLLSRQGSNSFLRETNKARNNIATENNFGNTSLLYHGEFLLSHISLIAVSYQRGLYNGPMLLYPMLDSAAFNCHPLAQDTLKQSYGSRESIILSGLQTSSQNTTGSDTVRQARTLLILGAPILQAIRIELLPDYIDRIVMIESSPKSLAAGLLLSNLQTIVNDARSRGIGIQFLLEANLNKLRLHFCTAIVSLQPTALFGMRIIRSPVLNPCLEAFEVWLRSPEGLTQHVIASLGSEVDEINQLRQAIFLSLQRRNRKFITYSPKNRSRSVVLTASGPSLDLAIPWLYSNRQNIKIVASGGSLGALMHNRIQPDAVVLLEHDECIFHDIFQLVEKGYDLSKTILFASMTLDPRIHLLFARVVWFHRPLSSTLAFFYHESQGKLLQSGPESINAGLEVVLYLGFSRVLGLGCDFGTSKRSYPRAHNALGSSSREFTVPTQGRSSKTVFSTPQLLSASASFSNALNAYDAIFFSLPFGVDLNSPVTLCQLDEKTLDTFRNNYSLIDDWTNLKSYSLEPSEVKYRLVRAKDSLHKYCELLISIASSKVEWDIDIAREFDRILSLDSSEGLFSDVFIRRLIRLPVFIVVQLLSSSHQLDWPERRDIYTRNISWLEDVYSEFLEVLLNTVNSVSRGSFEWHESGDSYSKVADDS